MPLFVVQHRHEAQACPAGDPKMGPMLLQHISKNNAASMGITIHGEAVVDGAHTFYIILEAQDAEVVREFMNPFSQVGTVELMPANACEAVVQRGRC